MKKWDYIGLSLLAISFLPTIITAAVFSKKIVEVRNEISELKKETSKNLDKNKV